MKRSHGPKVATVAGEATVQRAAPARSKTPTPETTEAVPQELSESPLYGVAMLKIAMELKKPGAKELDEILAGVLARMQIPEDRFREFLSQNGGLLRTIAQKRQY